MNGIEQSFWETGKWIGIFGMVVTGVMALVKFIADIKKGKRR